MDLDPRRCQDKFFFKPESAPQHARQAPRAVLQIRYDPFLCRIVHRRALLFTPYALIYLIEYAVCIRYAHHRKKPRICQFPPETKILHQNGKNPDNPRLTNRGFIGVGIGIGIGFGMRSGLKTYMLPARRCWPKRAPRRKRFLIGLVRRADQVFSSWLSRTRTMN